MATSRGRAASGAMSRLSRSASARRHRAGAPIQRKNGRRARPPAPSPACATRRSPIRRADASRSSASPPSLATSRARTGRRAHHAASVQAVRHARRASVAIAAVKHPGAAAATGPTSRRAASARQAPALVPTNALPAPFAASRPATGRAAIGRADEARAQVATSAHRAPVRRGPVRRALAAGVIVAAEAGMMPKSGTRFSGYIMPTMQETA
ncbi:hypothetical protein BOSE21B_90726 [Bosea sp. 21B]|nr:hypothetical protein BOSE7B_50767 [Bosea sp. 7B]CAD5297952.1 hypothetical protein BOSE21B_90726 [Bosea sp. 21B]